jgi:hypothetical protein
MKTIKEEDEGKFSGRDTGYFSNEEDFNNRDDHDADEEEEYNKRKQMLFAGHFDNDEEDN